MWLLYVIHLLGKNGGRTGDLPNTSLLAVLSSSHNQDLPFFAAVEHCGPKQEVC